MLKWKYLENQFDQATSKSYKKALKLSNYHDAALQAAVAEIPELAPLYDRYHPLHLDYVQAYTDWRSAGGKQEGQTLNVEQLLDAAMLKLDVWEPQILVAYPKTSVRYKEIFPNGRKPFRQGGLDGRINAFNTLSTNIGADPALATIKIDVDKTYNDLDVARDTQEGAKGAKKSGSQKVDTARLAAMNMQYRNMGFIIDNFFDTRADLCSRLFDLETLRENDQSIFTGTLDPGETEQVLVHTFAEDDEMKLKIDTDGPVSFYLASTPGGKDSTPVTLSTPTETTIAISAFALPSLAGYRFLTAVSGSIAVCKYRVQLL